MNGLPTRIVRARPAAARFALAAALIGFVPACRTPPTQIVLVVDTNLTGVDLDEVKITVTAATGAADAASRLDAAPDWAHDVALTDGGRPTFPLTLGIEPSGAPGGLNVSVQGLMAGKVVVQQFAVTSFVSGEQKMLRLLLLDSCVGTPCAGTGASQTCTDVACEPVVKDGTKLPAWPGAPPASPMPSPTVQIGGRTIWSNGWHSCANEGSILYCWGRNTDGEIGDGTTANAKTRVPVMNIHDLAAVGLGQFSSCVCDRGGTAWCWGRNVEGQLGTGSASVTSTFPVQVSKVADCVQIGAGRLHTCAVHMDGSVSCWGGNTDGQVGQPVSAAASCPQSTGSPTPCVLSPTVVPNLADVAEVHGGEHFTCARKNDLTVWCWGDNTRGTLGDGTNTTRSTPTRVVGLDQDVVEITTGRGFACARHMSGTVSCWGGNDSGQLGDGTTTDRNRPVLVAGITDATQVGGGLFHTCALHASGDVACWGDNRYGQLGNGKMTNSLAPMNVPNMTAEWIAVGSDHSCARSHGGAALCWGHNDVFEDGDSALTNRTTPVNVAGFRDSP